MKDIIIAAISTGILTTIGTYVTTRKKYIEEVKCLENNNCNELIKSYKMVIEDLNQKFTDMQSRYDRMEEKYNKLADELISLKDENRLLKYQLRKLQKGESVSNSPEK